MLTMNRSVPDDIGQVQKQNKSGHLSEIEKEK